MQNYFEQLPHTADLKVRVYGATKEDLFIHALEAMFQVTHPRIKNTIECNILVEKPDAAFKREIAIQSIDEVNLLVDFLSEVLCLSDTYNEVYFKVVIHNWSSYDLRATLYGTPIEGFDGPEIKAVTYNELVIEKNLQGWQADIVFDI